MEKQKTWQFWLIVAVVFLTVYNILPTIFYYTKPLHQPIDEGRAKEVATGIIDRVNALEEDSQEWLASFSKLIGVKPVSIQLQDNEPQLIKIVFSSDKDAARFKRFIGEAGSLIPFVPAQLSLDQAREGQLPTEVFVSRRISVHMNPNDVDQYFRFSKKNEADGTPTPQYRSIVYDRAANIALGFSSSNRLAYQIASIAESTNDQLQEETIISTAKEIADAGRILQPYPKIAERWYASLAQGRKLQGEALMQKFVQQLQTTQTKLKAQREAAQKQQAQLTESGEFPSGHQQQSLVLLDNQLQALYQAITFVNANMQAFKSAKKSLTLNEILAALRSDEGKVSAQNPVQVLSLKGTDPLVESLAIDWSNDKIVLQFYPDVDALRNKTVLSEGDAIAKEKLNALAFDDMARVSSQSDEQIIPDGETFAVKLNSLNDSQSFLIFDLGNVAKNAGDQVLNQISETWTPLYSDLVRSAYPINNWDNFQKLSPDQQRLGLVVYAPAMYDAAPKEGFSNNSLYVIAKGLGTIIQKYKDNPQAEGAQQLNADIQQLSQIMQQNGFIAYPGNLPGIDPAFRDDYLFKKDDYYGDIVKATRENFTVKGSQRFAVLDFTDVEQRILTNNRILDREQEDLLKSWEEYRTSRVDLDGSKKYLVPEPTKNPYWQNFKISFAKYFKGDDRKVLKWGLDLSGGKTVRIGLRDSSNKPVTNPDDLKQAVNELYTRVNKMGVSERTIRIENNNIVLDFPGSQGLSAAELVKASAMYFHIVNEKFQPYNREVGPAVRQFLEEVWNEAVVTNRKDTENVNEIAFRHLGGSLDAEDAIQPRSEAAQTLWDNGLRLADPLTTKLSSSFNDTISTVGVYRGDDLSDWHGQRNPLVILFSNYALEGSSLTDIQVGWDQTQGYALTFKVKSAFDTVREEGTGTPRDDFYTWTSQFAEDRIVGTSKETDSGGHGWRMAVVLNGQIISAPAELKQALRDGGSITGRFTQRQVNQLAADLKAGSLTFTPRILSEENVSPELGKEERTKGISASLIALALVVVAMVGYYRFGGLVASCAVLFNILIMWGVLQNLDAALTLPGIAGIVLTIGMAIDANVLVFERVREEFKISGRIASAIQAGYRKAFSAIFDSNITTIIVAYILIQFDSGPIRGFAVTIIIGIISSMFTALFMTRYFFAGWVQNPKNKELSMAQFIGKTDFDFLAQTRKAIAITLVVVAAGIALLAEQRNTIFGMDFTGGYSLIVEAQEQPGDVNYRLQATDALLAQGATMNDIQVRQLSQPWKLRIQLGMSMEEPGHPFYQMPTELDGKFAYNYQSNPRMAWVVSALEKGGVKLSETQLSTLERQWTVMSGQFSETMRNNAIKGLVLALLAILVYITLRFEFKFAIAAVIGLIHDVVITLGIIALFHKLGFPVQLDLETIGAIMMIIGYSLNDTIIVFDRIREDTVLMRKMPYRDVINHAINVTLSRTIMTSGTTLLVLLALVLFGGESIFSFSLVMAIGVIVGTLSSLFIAAPVMLYFHNREENADTVKLSEKNA